MALEKFQITGAPVCRIVYPKGCFEKTVVKGTDGDPKYNAVIIVPKDDKAKVDQINAKFTEAFNELRAKGFTGKTPSVIEPKNNCWKDGDVLAETKEGYEQFRGYMMLSVGSPYYPPLVTDRQKLVITNGVVKKGLSVEQMSDQELNDGDYIIANVSFWTYNKAAFGIGCNCHAIVKFADGEPIAGVSQNVDDYIDLSQYD